MEELYSRHGYTDYKKRASHQGRVIHLRSKLYCSTDRTPYPEASLNQKNLSRNFVESRVQQLTCLTLIMSDKPPTEKGTHSTPPHFSFPFILHHTLLILIYSVLREQQLRPLHASADPVHLRPLKWRRVPEMSQAHQDRRRALRGSIDRSC